MQRCRAAPQKTSRTARASPAWAPETTRRTPDIPRARSDSGKSRHDR